MSHNIDITNVENIYLKRDESHKYVIGLNNCINILKPYLTNKKMRSILKDLQVSGDSFDENKYIQAACETSVSASLAEAYPNNFRYEVKLNPPKDVDCVFENAKFTYNVEIKCADFSKKNAIDSGEYFSLGSFGRFSGFNDAFQVLDEIFNSPEALNEENSKPLVAQHHMDNKLKDFLKSAHGKFNSKICEDQLNVLVVCCSDEMDMQKWYHYMYGTNGLFSHDSFCDPQSYSSVDIVVLTNLYHRHHKYWDKHKITNYWNLSNSFNLIFSNPFRKSEKERCILSFVDSIPNHSFELSKYKSPDGIDELRIPQFVLEKLSLKEDCYFDHASNKTN